MARLGSSPEVMSVDSDKMPTFLPGVSELERRTQTISDIPPAGWTVKTISPAHARPADSGSVEASKSG